MNILNFIKFENYYVLIDDKLRNLLDKKIKNKLRISKNLRCSYATLSRIINKKNYWCNLKTLFQITNKLKINDKFVESHILKLKTHNSFPIKFKKIKINESFYRILGHILGDGGIHVIAKEGKYRAFYANKKSELINSFKEDVISIFGKIKLYERTRKTQVKEIWLPTTLGYLLYEIMEYKKNKIKRIPSFVYKTRNSKLLSALLQAFYDDEGYLYPQKYMIVISQKYKALVNDFRKIVKKIGINPNQILIHNAKNRTKMYYFSITSKENIIKFAKKVNFIHPDKKKKLKILVNKYRGA